MTISVPEDKKLKLIKLIHCLLNKQICKIRSLARVIGTIISVCPAVAYGWGYSKSLEWEKIQALHKNKGNFNKFIRVSNDMKHDLMWWLVNIKSAKYHLMTNKNFEVEIFSDASRTGWGAVCGDQSTHGFWTESEMSCYINILELKAALYSLKSLARDKQGCSILLRIDNQVAIAYINKMGGTRCTQLKKIARDIWHWCEKRRLYLFASYIQSKQNFVADAESRHRNIESEYSLDPVKFQYIVIKWGLPEIDLFASSTNTKIRKFVSWRPDPLAFTVDAFTIKWDCFFYAFPPFSLITKCLNKIINEKCEGILVVPLWKAQPWFPVFKKLFMDNPIYFKPHKNLLLSPFRISHPLWKKTILVAAKLSGQLWKNQDAQQV